MTVTAENDAPLAADDTASTNEDVTITFNAVINDTDIDGTINAATVDLDPATAGIQTTFTVAGQGTYTVDISGLVTFSPVLNFNGTTTPVTYTVRDNSGATSNVASIRITVASVNDVPLAVDDAETSSEDVAITIGCYCQRHRY
ncbi:MAG: cadherin-like domain-containing protein [Sphingobacterium sp.]|nr:cadherin-like domain-containing protein [Sphingobacterium sp.]